MHPTQHSTCRAPRGMTKPEGRMTKPSAVETLLLGAVEGLQTLSFEKARQETHRLNIEPRHAPLLRQAAETSRPFRTQPSPQEAA